ncbi:hypothetical protein MUP95_05285, partial [bacterium]|nr:hypothetical protein [bacterium]
MSLKYFPFIIIIMAFVSLLLSCSTTKYQKLDTLPEFIGGKITNIEKMSGESVYFVESSGIINEDSITVKKTVRKEIEKDDIKLLTTLFYRIGQPYKYRMVTKDGRHYDIRSYKELDDKSVWMEFDEEISIPISEIKEIEIQKADRNKSGL